MILRKREKQSIIEANSDGSWKINRQ